MKEPEAMPEETPPPPPPDPEPAPPPAVPDSAGAASYDLGAVLAAAFRDPLALRKFVLGCVAVLLIPVFGLGLLALLGFMGRTVGKALEGADHPLADWDDVGGLLLDGLRVVGLGLVWAVIAFVLGGLLVATFTMLGAILASTWSTIAGVAAIASVFAGMGPFLLVGVVVTWGVLVHVLFQAALLRMVAADRLGDGLQFDAVIDLVRANLGTTLYLILTIVLISVLGDLSWLICLVGVIPGTFWVFATYGVAVGHAGRLMGVTLAKS